MIEFYSLLYCSCLNRCLFTDEEIEGISEHESELNLSNLRETQTYTCIARNNAGSSEPASSTINVVAKGNSLFPTQIVRHHGIFE